MLCLISARFYPAISQWLEEGAVKACKNASIDYRLLPLSGALEIPQAIQQLAIENDIQGFVALGCVIRGETSHYDIVCQTSALGIQQVALEQKIPVTNGILTVENRTQAEYRAHPQRGNKGGFAVNACLELMKLREAINV